MNYHDIVNHFFNVTKCTLREIVKMTSYNTCKQFKIKHYGNIVEGAQAKLIILDEKDNILDKSF